jgi:hypothetical protein
MLLSDATLVFNGKYARMQIKQKDRAFVQQLWNLFNELGIVGYGPALISAF